EPNGSPLFPLIPLVTCRRYEPREHPRPLALARPEIPPSPLSDRVGYSDHVRFRGYFSVHCISAYNLPVYASQWPLPDTTQDSVRGCSLGFTAAAISSGRVQRTFQGATLIGRVEDWRAGRSLDRATFPAPSTSHAACGFPALRAPICFTPPLMGPILL